MNINEQSEGGAARMREAAQAYERFLSSHPEERAAMEEWESAPLVDSIESSEP